MKHAHFYSDLFPDLVFKKKKKKNTQKRSALIYPNYWQRGTLISACGCICVVGEGGGGGGGGGGSSGKRTMSTAVSKP